MTAAALAAELTGGPVTRVAAPDPAYPLATFGYSIVLGAGIGLVI